MKLKRFIIGLIYLQRRFYYGLVLGWNAVLPEEGPSNKHFMAAYGRIGLWHCIDHMLRRDRNNVVRQALNYQPQAGKEKNWRGKDNWR